MSLPASLLLVLAFLQEAPFSEFSFCREALRPADPARCVTLDAAGAGVFRERDGSAPPDDPASFDAPFLLSPTGRGTFLELLEATAYLQEVSDYESGRAVANTGLKILTLEGDFGRREGAFNYSTRQEVNALVTFLDRLIVQETFLLRLQFAMEFSRLELPTLLEEVEIALGGNRFADPPRLLDALGRIAEDGRVVNYAREAARELAEKILED